MRDGRPPVGVVLGSALAPEQIPRAGKLAEDLGFSAAWVSEDYFFTSGIASAATILARTAEIDVGLGIVSALTRHPALLAMEISTLTRMHPGRLVPAVGLGLPRWMAQMGLTPESSLGAVRAAVTNLRRLLAGEEVTSSDGPFSYDRIRLAHPLPDGPPPVWMGVSGPAMLRLAGEVADGVVISVMAGVDYIRWARERLAEGASRVGRDADEISMNVFAFMSVDDEPKRAKTAVRKSLAYYLAGRPDGPVPRAYGITEELQRLAAGGPGAVEQHMPEQWVDDLAVAGDPAECARKIARLLDAGADQVSIYACPVERAADVIRLTGTQVLPLTVAVGS
jgi:alkanesulfonate monooxygenase SsuD/methylene tetrahydromethanopterin reductase-like flavin-dependent oxidoreductase (luciferase family)